MDLKGLLFYLLQIRVKTLHRLFLDECNQLGVSPVAIEWYSEKPKDISKQLKNIRKIAWGLVEEEKDIDQIMVIDSLDALFDVDVTDFFSFPDNEEVMEKRFIKNHFGNNRSILYTSKKGGVEIYWYTVSDI